jgi:uncharacterized FlgJ-related protein
MYRLNKETLAYEKVTLKFYAKALLFLLLSVAGLSYTTVRVIESEKVPVVITNDSTEELTKESLRLYLKECNVKFPEIVLKQALLESNSFKSNVFKQNNNLFGMRISTSRPTTHKGDNLGFAYYTSWKESVLDYALWQASYTKSINSEKQYYDFLDEIYCTDVTNGQSYSQMLKRL